jgi:hypothetical protein
VIHDVENLYKGKIVISTGFETSSSHSHITGFCANAGGAAMAMALSAITSRRPGRTNLIVFFITALL